MTDAANRAMAHPNDASRLLCLMHEIAEGAYASVDLDDKTRPHNLIDGSLCIVDHINDDDHIREHLLYVAAQAVAWLLVIDRRRAAS